MTRFTPNGLKDYLDLRSGGDWLNNNPGLFCVSEPAQQLPCTPQAGDNDAFAGARSRHPGGINVCLGDGSVRFIKNTINHLIWIGINSISGGEVISSDSLLSPSRPGDPPSDVASGVAIPGRTTFRRIAVPRLVLLERMTPGTRHCPGTPPHRRQDDLPVDRLISCRPWPCPSPARPRAASRSHPRHSHKRLCPYPSDLRIRGRLILDRFLVVVSSIPRRRSSRRGRSVTRRLRLIDGRMECLPGGTRARAFVAWCLDRG